MKLTKEQRQLLSITSKTNIFTEELMKCASVSDCESTDFKTLVASNLLKVEKKIDGFHIKTDPELKSILEIEFLDLPAKKRQEVCTEIAKMYFKNQDVISALRILSDSGDKRLFTNAMLENSIELTNNQVAQTLIELADQMLIDDQIDLFAQKSFKIAGNVWLGKYLLALELISEAEEEIATGKIDKKFYEAILLLRAICNSYMGRVLAGNRDIEEFMVQLNEQTFIQESAVINGCKLYASTALLTLNFQKAKKAFETASKYMNADTSIYFRNMINQIEAVKYFVAGELNKAYEKALTVIETAKLHGYLGMQGPLDALYIKASCEEEFLEFDRALSTWSELRITAEVNNLPAWYCVTTLRVARSEAYLNPKIDITEEIRNLRKYYELIPYRNELDIVIDIEEFFVAYRTGNLDRAKVLYNRIPKSPRIDEVAMGIAIKTNKKVKFLDSNEKTPRQEIMNLLSESNDETLTESKVRQLAEKILALGETNGFYRMLCFQNSTLTTMLVRVASEGNSSYHETIARIISERSERKLGLSNIDRIALTVREKEILALLAAGFERVDICKQLALSLNTLKTHQKNIYKKVEAKNREQAVSNARKLGLLTQ